MALSLLHSPKNGKWLHHTAPPQLRKQAGKRVKRSLGGAVRRTAGAVSVTCHNLPGSCKTKCHYSGDIREFPSPGSSCEEDWELSASGVPDQAVLVIVSQRG